MDYSLVMANKKSEQICIRLDVDTYEKLKEVARLEDRSVGYLIRKMINDALAKEKSSREKISDKKRA